MLRGAVRKRTYVLQWLKHSCAAAAVSGGLPPAHVPTAPSPSPTPGSSLSVVCAAAQGFSSAVHAEEVDDTESVTPEGFTRWLQRLTREGAHDRVAEVFDRITKRIVPTVRDYTLVMKAHSRLNEIDMVRRRFDDLLRRGFVPDKFVFNTLIYANANTGDADAAFETMREMVENFDVQPDDVTYRSLVAVCGRGRDLARARETFRDLQQRFPPDVRNYNVMINALAENVTAETAAERCEEGRALLDEARTRGLNPDGHTYGFLARLSVKATRLEEAVAYLNEAASRFAAVRPGSFDALIDALAELQLDDETLSAVLFSFFRCMLAHQSRPAARTFERVLALYGERLEVGLAFLERLSEINLDRSAVTLSCKALCVQRLVEASTWTPQEGVKRLEEILEKGRSIGVVYNYVGYRAWLRVCFLASDVDTAFECWDKFTTEGHRPTLETTEWVLQLTIDHDRVANGVHVLAHAQSEGVVVTDEILEKLLTHSAQNGRKTEAALAQKILKKGQRQLTESMRKDLVTLGLL